jgi:hypothetical protein
MLIIKKGRVFIEDDEGNQDSLLDLVTDITGEYDWQELLFLMAELTRALNHVNEQITLQIKDND